MAKTRRYRALYTTPDKRRRTTSFWATSTRAAWGKVAAWLAVNRPTAVLLDVVEVSR